jgi:vacuolar-type H+-ATPase subunit I/STV1
MRLTFVEFYKNSGFMGGGKPFTPLARKAENQTST